MTDERRELRKLALRIAQDDPGLGQAPGTAVASGSPDLPGLVIHDMSAGRLCDATTINLNEYRGLWLARERDTTVLSAPRSAGFERHVTESLGLPDPTVVSLESISDGRLAAATAATPRLMAQLSAIASSAGGLVVHPYQATADVWKLAREIHRQSGLPVRVSGPPAAVADRVNDKVWFVQRVGELLGERAVPPTKAASNLRELVVVARQLAAGSESIVAKLPWSSGGEGVLVLPSQLVSALPPRDLAAAFELLLSRAGWQHAFPLQVGAWERPVLSTPSIQLWIPHSGQGPPRVQGIFEQRIAEMDPGFAGAKTSTLPDDIERGLSAEAVWIATLFQELGYFGQCSFDSILVGEALDGCAIHWIECNGRWGGTSIPMALMDRLTGEAGRMPFQVSIRRDLEGPLRHVDEAYDRLGDLLFHHGAREGALLLSPTAFERGIGFDVVAFASDRTATDALMSEAERRLRAAFER